MASPRLPSSAIMTLVLLVVGAIAGGASMTVQGLQSRRESQATAMELTGGDPDRGKTVWRSAGCGACHEIDGVDEASGKVGPPLKAIGSQALLAGRQPNDPSHLIAWVQHPQAVEPGVGMPELGLSDGQARDVAAYLYTLK